MVTKESLSSSDGSPAAAVSYERFVGLLDTALTAVIDTNTVTVNDADADIIRRVAVLYRVTELAVQAVGRGTRAAGSLLDIAARCYQQQFAAKVADQQGLVSVVLLKGTSTLKNIPRKTNIYLK